MKRKSTPEQRHIRELLQRCRNLRSLKQIHAQIISTGLTVSSPSSLREFIYTAAIVVPSAFPYALLLFHHLPLTLRFHPFVISTLIRAASLSPSPSLAFSLFSSARLAHPRLTLPFLLRASPSSAPQLHSLSLKLGISSHSFVRNSLINSLASSGDLPSASALFSGPAANDIVARSSLIAGYARRGQLHLARQLFDAAPCKDLVSWNIMLTAYCKRGDMDSARQLFDGAPKRDTVSWNLIIGGYARRGAPEKAMEVFEEMMHAGGRPDEVTMLSLIAACADSANLKAGMRLHASLGRGRIRIRLGNALIDLYAKCGIIERAVEVFDEMSERDVSSWNTVIGGLAVHGHTEEAIRLFEEMRRVAEGIRPDEITFVNALVACSHGGMVDEGRRYYEMMRSEYDIRPNVKHCGCMVDLLGRAGLLEEAFEFVKRMEVETNPVIWRTLLGACKIHGNVELGQRANEEILKLRWKNEGGSGDYVLLSNIYASVGEWGGVTKVRELMDVNGVIKEVGSALVEAGK